MHHFILPVYLKSKAFSSLSQYTLLPEQKALYKVEVDSLKKYFQHELMLKKIFFDIELFFAKIMEWVLPILNHKLFTFDKGDPVTLGKLIIGIFFLATGYYLTRKVSKLIEKKILTHLDIEPAVRHTMETFIFYFLVLLLLLFTLKLLNIPITVFTLIGGALAVGFGLGAQHIIYDFLSGVVMIIEHPIRKGDLIEVENVQGRVEHIGARASRIHTVDNKHLIVPNNFFLSKTVLNWTLSDEVIRGEIEVGVRYGSPTQKVVDLIQQAAKEHPKIQEAPEPIILFSDFGDNALVFRLNFWAKIASLMDMRKIKSALRFRIDELFRESEIVIAFPQRDLHFKSSSSPLQVEVLSKK